MRAAERFLQSHIQPAFSLVIGGAPSLVMDVRFWVGTFILRRVAQKCLSVSPPPVFPSDCCFQQLHFARAIKEDIRMNTDNWPTVDWSEPKQ